MGIINILSSDSIDASGMARRRSRAYLVSHGLSLLDASTTALIVSVIVHSPSTRVYSLHVDDWPKR